ncbi:MAG: AMP-binding protein [Actinomycetota bacterium]|nr:AMP-binding protein [Actinomycetota bacterium]
MFETGVRQLRLAMSMVSGRAIDARNVERLIGDALATLAAFGSPGDDLQEMLDGPFADPQARRAFQEQALRRTARRLARRSPYYRALFGAIDLQPKGLTLEDMAAVPATAKAELLAQPADFVVDGARPHVTTRTTGTTGQPVEVWLSRYELELWPALAALSGLLRDEIRPDDCMQINISSRATAAMAQNMAVCRLVGARTRPLGIVPVAESLNSLLGGPQPAPTLLATYPSYLAELVKLARRKGLGSEDFRLRRVDCGGEVLSPALARAARETLGPVRVNDTFGMTEVLPVSGRVCEQGHLHHDLNMGFVEVIDIDTAQPAAPGELGSVVITPYYPYRECMPVFRYDTRDVVRQLDHGELTCSLAATPATSQILGKADHLLRVNGRAVTPREIVEACEALPGEPWPARVAVRALSEELELTLSQDTVGALTADEVARRIAVDADGVPIVCTLRDGPSAAALRPLRADLIESTFTGAQRS